MKKAPTHVLRVHAPEFQELKTVPDSSFSIRIYTFITSKRFLSRRPFFCDNYLILQKNNIFSRALLNVDVMACVRPGFSLPRLMKRFGLNGSCTARQASNRILR